MGSEVEARDGAHKMNGKSKDNRAKGKSSKKQTHRFKSSRLATLAKPPTKAASEAAEKRKRTALEDGHMLLDVPLKKFREFDISLNGYHRHVEKNHVRLENDLSAEDVVERSDADLAHEKAGKDIMYMDMLLVELNRYLWPNHKEKALKAIAKETEAARKAVENRVEELKAAAKPQTAERLSDAGEEDEDEDEGEEKVFEAAEQKDQNNCPPSTDANRSFGQNGGESCDSIIFTQSAAAAAEKAAPRVPDGSLRGDLVPDLTTQEVEQKWVDFFKNGFFVGKRVDLYDATSKFKGWYPSRIDKIMINDESVNSIDENLDLNIEFVLSIRAYGYKESSASTFRFTRAKLNGAEERESLPFAPSESHISVTGKGYPKPKTGEENQSKDGVSQSRRRTFVEVDADLREAELKAKGEFRSWDLGAKVSMENLVSGKRRRKERNLFKAVPASADKAKDEEDNIVKYSGTVCGICGEQSYKRNLESTEELYICEGGCGHVYHAPCLNLETVPEGKFICEMCQSKSHACFFCFGAECSGAVSQCSVEGCSRFFHPACVRRNTLTARIFRDDFLAKEQEEKRRRKEERGRKRAEKKRQKQAYEHGSSEAAAFATSATTAANSSANPAGEPILAQSASTAEGVASTAEGVADQDAMMVDTTQEGAATDPAKSDQGPAQGQQENLKFEFSCMGHTCLTCIQQNPEDVNRAQSGVIKRCQYCKNGYHLRCLPYGALSNDLGFLCNECAREYDPPLSGETETKFLQQKRQRHELVLDIDFSRKFQKDALDMNTESGTGMRLSAELMESRGKETKGTKGKAKEAKSASAPKKAVKVPKYTKIASNKYSKGCKPVVNKSTLEENCNCDQECDENCYNRVLRIECFCSGKESNCNLMEHRREDHCNNQMFQRRQYKNVKIIETPGRGHGLQVEEAAEQDDFIVEYVGEVISQAESQRRLQKMVKGQERHVFQMDIGNEQVIDARHMGNVARFINHSCEPNCVLHKWNVRGITRVGIFAKRSIAAGEELSFDYSFDKSAELDFVCLCGAPSCRGTLSTVTTKENQAAKDLDQVNRKIDFIKRSIKQARGGLLKKNTLYRLIRTELLEVTALREELEKRDIKSAKKILRNGNSRATMSTSERLTKDLDRNLQRVRILQGRQPTETIGSSDDQQIRKLQAKLSYERKEDADIILDPFVLERKNRLFLLRNLRVGQNFARRLEIREERLAKKKSMKP